jgi:predicted transcriptional regulator
MVGATPEISDTALLRQVRLSPDPIVTATEIADRTGYSRQAINYRFQNLVADGYLDKREVGARATVYWLTDAGERAMLDG